MLRKVGVLSFPQANLADSSAMLCKDSPQSTNGTQLEFKHIREKTDPSDR